MPAGTPINRQYVLVLEDGRVVLDWGDGLFQDIDSGEFFRPPGLLSGHPVQDDELDVLRRGSRVSYYDRQTVYFINLKDRPLPTIE
jgi:hypothetical protein